MEGWQAGFERKKSSVFSQEENTIPVWMISVSEFICCQGNKFYLRNKIIVFSYCTFSIWINIYATVQWKQQWEEKFLLQNSLVETYGVKNIF